MSRTTEEEKTFWYFGMSRPDQCLSELVARSSTTAFKSAMNDPAFVFWLERQVKVMSTVKGHKIVDSYDTHLRSRVRGILKEAAIRWLTIDVVCLGFKHEESDHPPVVLITVDINNVDGESAQNAVYKIHELMIENDLPDVHAEIKTGLYSEEATYGLGDIYPLDFARVPKMGASISGTGLAGSIGLFLTVNGGKYALTCHHVVSDSLEAFTPTDGIEIPILQPGEEDLERKETALDKT
ncbi:hypothetical protein VF21_04955 [Pseudogymnoascus sp. 05NY08]|nr:hypothetical protein VF21_04955 [Pseudogymnoascus sp. 05NY08]